MRKQKDAERLIEAKLKQVRHEQSEGSQEEPQKKRLTNAVALSLAEQRIQEAMERGEFENLQGMGRPLDLNDDLFVPEELRMAYRLLRNNGYAPLWIEIRKELRMDEERLRRFQEQTRKRWHAMSSAERGIAQSWVRTMVQDLNSRILSYNLSAPSSSVHLELYRLEEQLLRLEA